VGVDRFGAIPFAPVFRVHPSGGVILETRFTLSASGKQSQTASVGESGDFRPLTLNFVGIFNMRIDRIGITNTGVTVLTKNSTVEGNSPPAPGEAGADN